MYCTEFLDLASLGAIWLLTRRVLTEVPTVPHPSVADKLCRVYEGQQATLATRNPGLHNHEGPASVDYRGFSPQETILHVAD